MVAVRVLLVEDESLIRMTTSEFLQDEGFEVTEAWNGDEAVRLLDTTDPFDVLFTDVQMPGTLDGIDLAIRARYRYAMIPLLVVSGYAAQLMTRLSVLKPPAVFIGKPYDLKGIVDALRRMTIRP